MRRMVRVFARMTAVLGALALVSCDPQQHRPNVVLITVDTLRADRLGCYGARSTHTPNMDRLAAEGTLFLSAVSPMPSTRPSHASMFTSLQPRDHGVVNNSLSLPDDIVTLAELFREAGYSTAGFTGVSILGPGFGLERGFDVLETPSSRQRRASEVVTAAVQWLEARTEGKPAFLWVHLFDPHMPYDPPEPFRADLPERLEKHGFSRQVISAFSGDLPGWLRDYAVRMYSGEVEYVDSEIGRLLETLELRPPWRESILVLTADHGECFEKGLFFEHGGCLYEGTVRVPLIVRFPGVVDEGVQRSDQVLLTDLAPTLLDLAAITVPSTFSGRRLFTEDSGGTESAAVLQATWWNDRQRQLRRERRGELSSVAGVPTRSVEDDEQYALRTGSWKYIMEGDVGELYFLAEDPDETRNLVAEQGDLVRDFRQRILDWRRSHPLVENDSVLDNELEDELKALGYL